MKITGLISIILYKIRKRAIDQDLNLKICSKFLIATYKIYYNLVNLESF